MSIIILSADATKVAKQESIEAGADEFLTKPVTSASLLAAIERLTAGTAMRASPLPSAPPAQKPASISPLAGSPSAPILVDQERIQSLRRIARGERKFLDQYVEAVFEELEKAIGDLRIAAMAGDTRTACDALHIIHGTGASIGAIALVANSKAMYNYLSNQRDPDLPGALAEISTSYALTKSTVLANLHQTRDEAFHKGSRRG
jgi:two-component system sensor histidine kinase RpfC